MSTATYPQDGPGLSTRPVHPHGVMTEQQMRSWAEAYTATLLRRLEAEQGGSS